MTHDQSASKISAEELAALEAIANLSDEALWAAAREQMPADIQARMSVMSVLMTKNTRGTITNDEYAAHVEDGDKLTLRKAISWITDTRSRWMT